MVDYIIKPEELSKMLESLQELYQESEYVSPKMLVERITQKIGRNYNYHHVSYLFTLMGFVTGIKGVDRYIVRDDERINKLISELPQIEARTKASAGTKNPSIYSGSRDFTTWHYFQPY